MLGDENLYCFVCEKLCKDKIPHKNCWRSKRFNLRVELALKKQNVIDLEYELFLLEDIMKTNGLD